METEFPLNKLSTVIAIMGPTASGKTSLALELAKRFPVEIVSVDSALVYRGMNVGTSKPDLVMRQAVDHHLIDICEPCDAYSAAQFRTDALKLINDIVTREKIPLLVGGTMLYYRALFNGLSELPSADPLVRERLDQLLNDLGSQALHASLQKIDPIAARKIHPNDPQRIQRALEVFEITGSPISEWWKKGASYELPFNVIKLATMPENREVLHKIIEKRFDEMLECGFVQEVESLKSRGDLNLDKPSMRSVGYRQIWQFLDGEFDYKTMRDKSVAATRQLAKRQLTWLRAESHVHWMNTLSPDLLDQAWSVIRVTNKLSI